MHVAFTTACRATARVLAAACLLPFGLAQAQEIQAGAAYVDTKNSTQVDAGAWRFQVTPYVWMTGMSGDIRATSNVPTAHV
jgi:hypothetical protein